MTATLLERNPTFGADFAEQQRRLIARNLPPWKTFAEAVERATARKRHMWGPTAYEFMLMPEEQRIREFDRYCTGLCGGNKAAGLALSEWVAWL